MLVLGVVGEDAVAERCGQLGEVGLGAGAAGGVLLGKVPEVLTHAAASCAARMRAGCGSGAVQCWPGAAPQSGQVVTSTA